jgi:putative ABC transport system permease protein
MLFSMALRNALRNRRRSALTAATVLLGVALLTVAMCWVQGVFSGMLERAANQFGPVRLVTPAYAKREQLMPLYENIAVSKPVEDALRGLPGVTAVYPRIQTGVTVTAGEDIGEHFGLVLGAPLAYFDEVLDLDHQLSAGAMLAEDGQVVLGKVIAEEVGAGPGDEVVLLGQTQDGSMSPVKLTVAGVADLGNGQQNRLLFVTLEKARWMADIPEGAIELLVFGPRATRPRRWRPRCARCPRRKTSRWRPGASASPSPTCSGSSRRCRASRLASSCSSRRSACSTRC